MPNAQNCSCHMSAARHILSTGLQLPKKRPLHPRHVAMDSAPIQHVQRQRDIEVRRHVAMRQLRVDVQVGNLLEGWRQRILGGESWGDSGAKCDRTKKNGDYTYIYIYIYILYVCMYIYIYCIDIVCIYICTNRSNCPRRSLTVTVHS